MAFGWSNSQSQGLSESTKVSPTIKATRNGEPAIVILNDQGGSVMDVSDKVGCLRAQEHGHQSIVCYSIDCRNLYMNKGKSGTLQSKNQGGYSLNFINPVAIVLSKQFISQENKAVTLEATDYKDPMIVCVGEKYMEAYPTITGALCANSHPGSYTGQDAFNDMLPVIKENNHYILRRLTPTECARLQGFPDWWTDGAEGSDSAIYKMWGNGIALPCAADVIGRLARELDK